MHGMHARLPKNFVLEERLERYAQAIELSPASYRGLWAQACWPVGDEAALPGPSREAAFREVRLDLGCGKGAYLVESARRMPDTLFVGLDAEPICIAYTAQAICERGLANAVVAPARGSDVGRIFGPGELARITLNFPTPFPRKRDAAMRLVAFERLMEYRGVLAPEGSLLLRTDSLPLYRFALVQLARAGYELVAQTEDAEEGWMGEPVTEYERRLRAQGAHVLALEAVCGPEPRDTDPREPESLVDYLPDDLETLDYVPHGMQGTVVNLRNRRRHERRRTQGAK